MPRSPLHDIGVLLLRAVLGVVFLAHGLNKVGDLDGTQRYFDSLGIPAAGLMAPLAMFTEIIGGGLLILGLLAPLAGLALACTMAVALVAQHLGNGFFAADGGYEYLLVLGIACLAVAAIGAGRLRAYPTRSRTQTRPMTVADAAPPPVPRTTSTRNRCRHRPARSSNASAHDPYRDRPLAWITL